MKELIIFEVILGIGVLIFLYYVITIHKRKSEFKDWKVGDKVILERASFEYQQLKNLGKKYATLVGWDVNYVYLDINNITYRSGWSILESNKSATWRRNYESCKLAMGVEPGFTPDLEDDTSSGKINGISLDLLNETECNVYLKKAIEEEDYITAKLIRERLEKFR